MRGGKCADSLPAGKLCVLHRKTRRRAKISAPFFSRAASIVGSVQHIPACTCCRGARQCNISGIYKANQYCTTGEVCGCITYTQQISAFLHNHPRAVWAALVAALLRAALKYGRPQGAPLQSTGKSVAAALFSWLLVKELLQNHVAPPQHILKKCWTKKGNRIYGSLFAAAAAAIRRRHVGAAIRSCGAGQRRSWSDRPGAARRRRRRCVWTARTWPPQRRW